MLSYKTVLTISTLAATIYTETATALFKASNFECGPYGFICEGTSRVRLCEGENLLGPSFLCPANTRCNEDSEKVCENYINYIDPAITRNIRCHRNERIPDPNMPGCKGYILCIPNKNRFQGIKFQCTGDTIFNGYTRTCSAPNKYKCPLSDTTTRASFELYADENRRIDSQSSVGANVPHRTRPLECKNYKFSVTDDKGPVRATFFCPPRPVQGETHVRCTVFSSKFCITLERDDEDQFSYNIGTPYRKPRK